MSQGEVRTELFTSSVQVARRLAIVIGCSIGGAGGCMIVEDPHQAGREIVVPMFIPTDIDPPKAAKPDSLHPAAAEDVVPPKTRP